MNKVLLSEDIIGVIRSFYLCNDGDESTTDLILSIGSVLLGISQDAVLEMITSINPCIE